MPSEPSPTLEASLPPASTAASRPTMDPSAKR